MPNPNYRAGGKIYPKRFVTLQTNEDLTVEQSGAGELAIGISGIGAKYAPIPEVSDNPHAEEGDQPKVHGFGEEAYLTAGESLAAGAKLKPDTNGKGVAASAGEYYSAVALTATTDEDEDVRVFIERGLTDT